MKKITKVQALRWCRDLWKWLETQYNDDEKGCSAICKKYSWPGWKRLRVCIANCPCCQHRDEHDLECDECLLKSVWNGECDDRGSPYHEIKYVCTEIKYKMYCRQIWEGADRLLQEELAKEATE